MMTDKIEIKQFDVADYLDSEEAIAEYLDAIMEENPALYNAAMQDVEKARQRLAVTNVQAPIALAA
jgi:DNA-binding phage protein